jgi:WD40 repeat protein
VKRRHRLGDRHLHPRSRDLSGRRREGRASAPWHVDRGSGGGDDAIHVWDIRTGEEIARLTEVGVIIAFAVSPDGRWSVTLDTGGISRLWAIQPEDLIAQVISIIIAFHEQSPVDRMFC